MTAAVAVWTPSRPEAAAVRRGLGRGAYRGEVERVGVGGRTRAPRRDGAAPVAVAGIAGALAPDLRPGDVVVADEVRGPDGTRLLPGSSLLAARLRRDGLTVRCGPVLSVDHVVDEPERGRLAAAGALVVDMESAALLRDLPDGPLAVVRVVADAADGRLFRPVNAGRMLTALRTLGRIGPALEAWGAATGARRVLLAGPRSFCAGVVRAIDVVERALQVRGAPVYVRKQIVHNRHVVEDLSRRGAVFVDELDEVPPGSTVVFSAHGVSPAVRDQAEQRRLDVIDATCPLVSKVHAEVRRFADSGDTVIFVGHAGHEEAEGTMGERPGRTLLVESEADARTVAVPDPDQVSVLLQTTLAADEVEGILDILRARFPDLRQPQSDDICYATTNRQQALRSLAAEADLALVIGSTNSSNSQRLVEVSQRDGTPAYLIDDATDIRLEWLAGATTVALTAGASAPEDLVQQVVAALRGLGPVDVAERETTTEDVYFTLPKEVRDR